MANGSGGRSFFQIENPAQKPASKFWGFAWCCGTAISDLREVEWFSRRGGRCAGVRMENRPYPYLDRCAGVVMDPNAGSGCLSRKAQLPGPATWRPGFAMIGRKLDIALRNEWKIVTL